MKKNTFILMAMTAMFGLSSCDKELFSTENTNKTFTLFATTETGTKTALSGNDTDGYQVVWSKGDQFAIYNNSEGNIYTKVSGDFTLESGEGTPNGTFTGSATLNTGTEYMALYPASIYSESYNKTKWPATTQTYTAGNITNSPMFATFTVNEKDQIPTVSFKNMGGILRLTVKGTATVKSIKVSAAELPTPITLDCGNGVELTSEGIDFHIAMLTGTFTGVEITLTDTESKKCVKSFKGTDGLVVKRSMITKAVFTASDFKSYNVGSKVTIGGHEGIVVDLGTTLGKVIVATMNVGATAVNGTGCGGSSLSFADACDSITDGTWSGWRLPTVGELTKLCDVDYPTRGDTGEGEGKGALLWDFDENNVIDLYLPLNDYDGLNPYDRYWTGTPGEKDTKKCFYFAPELDYESGSYHDYVPIGYEYRDGKPYKEEADTTNTYLVRLFHDLP